MRSEQYLLNKLMSNLHISSLVANKGFTMAVDLSLKEFQRLMELFDELPEVKKKILNREDVILNQAEILSLKKSLAKKIKELLPKASNSSQGLEFSIFGSKVLLDSKRHEQDREIKFLIKFLQILDKTSEKLGKLYLLNLDPLNFQDGRGTIIGILNKNNCQLRIPKLLEIFNENQKIKNLNTSELMLLINYFQKNDLVILEDEILMLTDKGKAIILY